MTARAFAQDSLMTNGVRVAIKPSRDQIMLWGVSSIKTYRPEDAEVVDDNEAVWLHLPNDTGRALYEALDRFYGGVAQESNLRADLLHERRRVDHFIEVTTKAPINYVRDMK